jgi:hypothetical protein
MTGAEGGLGTRALGDAIAGFLDAPARMAAAFAGSLTQRGACGCEIPPPCWEPRLVGNCCLTIPPGCAATIRVHVSNCDWSRHIVGITALGHLAAWVKFEPTTMVLGPQERATFVVTVRVPDKVKPGATVTGPLLVRGCNDHFARIEVRVAECAGPTCCDLVVNDCPDHIHHWYDHFYCPRPCRNLTNRDLQNG